MRELEYLSKDFFYHHFVDVTKGLSKKEIAALVWNLLNKVWTDGRNFGRDESGKDDV